MIALRDCDALIIILDGRAIDEGASFELGCAYTFKKPCVGLKTDPRQLLRVGDNPMIEVALRETFKDIPQLVLWAREFVKGPSYISNIINI